MYSSCITEMIFEENWQGLNQLLKTECKKGIGFGLLATTTLDDVISRMPHNCVDTNKILDDELIALIKPLVQYRIYWETLLSNHDFDSYMRVH